LHRVFAKIELGDSVEHYGVVSLCGCSLTAKADGSPELAKELSVMLMEASAATRGYGRTLDVAGAGLFQF
jgi:hypothetical protein